MSRTLISPIRNERDYRAAVKQIEALWSAKPGTPEHDRLEVLGTLVDVYESKRWPIDAPDPVEAIRFRMEQGGLTQADLAKVLGSRSRASEVLRRKRPLTIGMVWSLSRAWKIPAESLVKPYRVQERRRA